MIVATATHHSVLTTEQSDALMTARKSWTAAGRPSDHEYARSIANIEWDGPAIAVRISETSYGPWRWPDDPLRRRGRRSRVRPRRRLRLPSLLVTDLKALTAQARRYHRRVEAVETDRASLYLLIREARTEGLSLRQIATVTGLSFGRIQQIVKS